ncbi:hypothetical protein NDU88_005386 [Pleurodeles waltl]|uniref:Uncharacterized protein n=1 Tax=Pleurodeles waltl TaxID=8319 RepID=A0AAV7VMM2_PLEWA|nr:hypothetical protein NDU88_005386 [Pleurodeles waltl]
MGKRKARGSPALDFAHPKIPKLTKAMRPLSNCVTKEIDTLIEEVELILSTKERNTQKEPRTGTLIPFLVAGSHTNSGSQSNRDSQLMPAPQRISMDVSPTPPATHPISEVPQIDAIIHELPCSNSFSLLEVQD